VASVTLPATAGSFTFSLTVTDTSGRSAQSTVTVVSTGGSTGLLTNTPTGGGGGGGGGGGAMSVLWGVALWAWLTAVWFSRRRAAKLKPKKV
jgi:serine protease